VLVPISRFTARNFRCLESVEFEPDPAYTLIWGANASGKTSILEALAYLGRGKSFRSSQTGHLIRHGQQEFLLYGEVLLGARVARLGVRNSPAGLEVRVDGDSDGGVAALAATLPLQVIDPAVHHLVSGGPDERRRFLDWMVFHVEHDYLDVWRRFRRTLKQRNAALKEVGARSDLSAWDAEFAALGERVDAARRRVFDDARGALVRQGEALLGTQVDFEYAPGWSEGLTLAEALDAARERDWRQGTTHTGPHRADVRLLYDERQARRLVSRGQQKLLASAMILAAAETAQRVMERPLLLLLDDPAAELDQGALSRLMAQVDALGSQVIVTSLERSTVSFPAPPTVFHVEHGRLSRE
jgi:DNA replication and repair protein RecF